ncbi:MAG: NUDIX hydrolase [Candidatus Methanomethylophilaceae archaeon]|nr:NUDIX hydrolase [Candidatus Methanomethylophilaceae archaeon]
MSTVYSMGVKEGLFLMVFNPKRKGWEMPGGSIEPGETPAEAARREFREESGMELEVLDVKSLDDCYVAIGKVGEKTGDGEMEHAFFRELPSPLAFTAEEYIPVLRWGWERLGRHPSSNEIQ